MWHLLYVWHFLLLVWTWVHIENRQKHNSKLTFSHYKHYKSKALVFQTNYGNIKKLTVKSVSPLRIFISILKTLWGKAKGLCHFLSTLFLIREPLIIHTPLMDDHGICHTRDNVYTDICTVKKLTCQHSLVDKGVKAYLMRHCL